MKKFLLIIAVALFSFNASAQGFGGGIGLGLPTGDSGDFFSFAINADLNYMWEVGDNFEAGLASGLIYVFGKDWKDGPNTIEVDDGQFLPIAATGRFGVSDEFSIIADIGYALGINDGNDGGFYYRPGLAYDLSDSMNINVSYTGVSGEFFDYNSINLGLGFKF